ncbi:MAG: hypothetical protein EHM83_03530, partial [Burkholderiales bacterium]
DEGLKFLEENGKREGVITLDSGLQYEVLNAGEGDAPFLAAKIATARFHADHILSHASALRSAAVEGAPAVLAMPESAF